MWGDSDIERGLDALRRAVLLALAVPAPAGIPAGATVGGHALLAEADTSLGGSLGDAYDYRDPLRQGAGSGYGDADLATSSEDDEAERSRLIALVELARAGDTEAFGLLYDHYQPSVYRFLYYRTRSVALAEDLTSETFLRALRNMNGFRWQGRDLGAWLMTIARNLTTDHYKAGRTRLEMTTEDMSLHDDATDGPEDAVLEGITHEILLGALAELPTEQRECIIMRFLQGLSIAETAAALGRSEGAVKQLQLRGVRNLAKLMPEGMRE
jgi:RNA polymerase sigma-70 factor, ECF subfamily